MTTYKKKLDLVISGVGGQGAILASDIIGKSAVLEGIPIRAAETHGMAQRGGSVVNHIRLGCELGSMIPLHEGDVLLALEPAEALRYIDLLSVDGVVIVNTQPVLPITVTSGGDEYPGVPDIVKVLKSTHKVVAFNASELAIKAGHPQTMNVVMVGAASNYLPMSEDLLIDCIKGMVPPKTVDINVRAFKLGREQVSSHNK
ncbi:MAG TPA: indolepyruvate oxidoreductase subunit beta [Methanosarcinaceae archaeon]|nr:indolepyruvate oxidoreductase subunit beta [Methanosarcinaceae archaeon]